MDKMKTRFLTRNRFLLAAFLAAAGIVVIAYGARHIYPLGDRTVLRVDLYHQYAPYIEELHSRILQGKSLLYSWEGGLGKDFIAQMAYYTTSPLNLLMFLFPEKNLPELIALLILLKISLCAVSFAWYLRDRFGRNDSSILLFGLLYAFCAFLTCYYWNIMWLDTVVLFPLVVRGADRILREGSTRLYYISLTLTMVVNFYLAVLVCVLIALYFALQVSSQGALWKNRILLGRRILRFLVTSLLCAVTSMFILAPVAMALASTAVSDSTFPAFQVYTNVWQLVTNHFLGARAAVLARNEDLPNVYTGVLPMVLLPLYYFNRRIPRREKAFLSVLPAFMLLCSCIRPLDYLIHGMHFPANLPHRFTFAYSFVLLLMAYQAFQNLGEVSLRPALLCCPLYLAVILSTEYLAVGRVEDIDRVLSGTDILLSAALMGIYLILLWMLKSPVPPKRALVHRLALPLLLACVLFECIFTSITNLEDTGSREAYIKYMDDASEAVAYLDQREEGGFYRTEFRRFTTINDASLYHYNGFSQFSSLEPGGISGFMQSLGIAATGNSFRYYDPTPFIDAIFNLKYVMNKDDVHPKAEKYEFLRQFGSVWVYQTPRVLPLAFLTKPQVLDWETQGSQPFAVQNDFLHKAAGVAEDMFTLMEPEDVSTQNISTTEFEGPWHFNYEVDDPANLGAEPSVSAVYESDKDQYLYLYVDAGNAQRFLYRNNSVNEDRELSAGRSLIDVGHVSEGEKIYVDFKLTKRGAFEKTYRSTGTVSLYAASYDDAVFQKAYDSLSQGGLSLDSFSDTRITGHVTASAEAVLFTSIPCFSGWKAYVDGERTSLEAIGNDGVWGLRLFPGEHEITLVYHNRVLLPALVLSGLGILLYCLYERYQKKHSS